MVDELADAQAIAARIQADHASWLARGIEISGWGVDDHAGRVDVGVRSDQAAAESVLVAAYGPLIRVFGSDPEPPILYAR